MDKNKAVSESDTDNIMVILRQIRVSIKAVMQAVKAALLPFSELCKSGLYENTDVTAKTLSTYAGYLKYWRKRKYLRRMANSYKRRRRRKPIHNRKNRRSRRHEQKRHGSHND